MMIIIIINKAASKYNKLQPVRHVRYKYLLSPLSGVFLFEERSKNLLLFVLLYFK